MLTVAAFALPLLIAQTPAKGIKAYTIAPGFSVSLPGKPQSLKLPNQPATLSTYFVKVEGGAYVISVVGPKPGEKRQSDSYLLTNFLAGFRDKSKGQELSRRDITLNGSIGVETKTKLSVGVTTWQKTYVVNGWIYQVSAAAAPPKSQLPDAKAVLDSIKLPKAK